MVDTHAHPRFVVRHIEHAVGYAFAQLPVLEIVDLHGDRLSLGAPFPPAVAEIPDQFLLFRINGNHRLTSALKDFYFLVDIVELGVAIRMAASFLRFPIGLQAVVRRMQQIGDRLVTNAKTLFAQRPRQMSQALACPSQGRLRIASCRGFHQGIQGLRQPRLRLCQSQTARSRTSHPLRRERVLPRREFFESGVDRTAGNPRRPMHQGNATVSGGFRFCSRPKPPLSLIPGRFQFGKSLPNRRFHACVSHGNDYINSYKKFCTF